MQYTKPALKELGSLSGLTEQELNKVGRTPDLVTLIQNPDVIGSFVPAPNP